MAANNNFCFVASGEKVPQKKGKKHNFGIANRHRIRLRTTTLMMEWETATTASVFSNSEIAAAPTFGNYTWLTQSTQTEDEEAGKGRVWNTVCLTGRLNDADVLLGEQCTISSLFKGTSFYLQQIKEYQQKYYETQESPQQLRLLQRIVESVWEKDGRFLTFDKRNGYVLLVPNDMILSRVNRDFIRAGKPRLHEISIQDEKRGASQHARKKRRKFVTKRTPPKAALTNSNKNNNNNHKKKRNRTHSKRKNKKPTLSSNQNSIEHTVNHTPVAFWSGGY